MKTSTKNAIITGIFSLVSGLIGVAVGNNIKTYSIENQIEKSGLITINNNSTFDSMEQLLIKYDELNNQIVTLTNDNYDLLNEINNLEKDYDILNESYKNIVDQYSQLKKQYIEIKQKNIISDVEPIFQVDENPSVFLYDLDYMALYTPEDDFYTKVSNLDDSIGSNHSNAIVCGALTTDDDKENNTLYAEYYINKRYTSLKGKIVIPEETKNCDDVYVVYFYGDDNYITQSDDITLGSLPYEFDVPLAGIIKLKIKVVRTERNSGNSSIAITEARFYE